MYRDHDTLEDIRLAAEQAIAYCNEVSKQRFRTSSLHQDATIRQLEIVGEAVKRLSEGLKARNKKIQWRRFAGIRNLLIHEYDSIDVDKVWQVVKRDLPKLLNQLQSIVLK